jgi:tetratricopeptide (TPR) repeat protein
MAKDFSFNFRVDAPVEGKQITAEEAEAILLRQLEERGGACSETLWQLAQLYSMTGRQEIALTYVQRMAAGTDDREEIAAALMAQGQLMEQMSDYVSASTFYRGALSLNPARAQTWYFINNNLGFCLNQLGRPKEAEEYFRVAIEADPTRANAFKNLGLSMQAQGQHAAAARSFIDGVKANASDPRAANHLEDLVERHRAEVLAEIPDIDEQLNACRNAVEAVRQMHQTMRRQSKPQ